MITKLNQLYLMKNIIIRKPFDIQYKYFIINIYFININNKATLYEIY